MLMELVLRFDYGSIVPWVRTIDGTLVAIAGPDAVSLRTPVALEGRNLRTHAAFTVEEGDRVPVRADLDSRRTSRCPSPSTPSTRSRRPSSTGRSGSGAALPPGAGRSPCAGRSSR